MLTKGLIHRKSLINGIVVMGGWPLSMLVVISCTAKATLCRKSVFHSISCFPQNAMSEDASLTRCLVPRDYLLGESMGRLPSERWPLS